MLKKLHVPDLQQKRFEACVMEAMTLYDLGYILDPWAVADKLTLTHIGISNEFKRKGKSRRKPASPKP